MKPIRIDQNTILHKFQKLALLFIISFAFATSPIWSQVESFCQTSALGPGPSNFSPPPQGNGNDYPGPYFLRLYIHVVQSTSGEISQTDPEIEEIIARLNSDFNPHNIFFAPVCEVDVMPSSGILDQPYNGGEFCDFYDYNRHSDGIDVYLLADEIIDGGGRAESVPGAMFKIGGHFGIEPFNIALPKSYVVSHEMGHCLGLWHTMHGTVNEIICTPSASQGTDYDLNQCPELVDGTISDMCGDYVEDTPADPSFFYTSLFMENFNWTGQRLTFQDCSNNFYTPPSNRCQRDVLSSQYKQYYGLYTS